MANVYFGCRHNSNFAAVTIRLSLTWFGAFLLLHMQPAVRLGTLDFRAHVCALVWGLGAVFIEDRFEISLPSLVRVLVYSMLFLVVAFCWNDSGVLFWPPIDFIMTVASHVSIPLVVWTVCFFLPFFLSHFVWLAPELREVVQPSVPSPVGHRRQRGGLVRLEARHPLHG